VVGDELVAVGCDSDSRVTRPGSHSKTPASGTSRRGVRWTSHCSEGSYS